MFCVNVIHASILRLGSGLSMNGKNSPSSGSAPFTLSLSKGGLGLSCLHFN